MEGELFILLVLHKPSATDAYIFLIHTDDEIEEDLEALEDVPDTRLPKVTTAGDIIAAIADVDEKQVDDADLVPGEDFLDMNSLKEALDDLDTMVSFTVVSPHVIKLCSF
jgi:hypothetical protein